MPPNDHPRDGQGFHALHGQGRDERPRRRGARPRGHQPLAVTDCLLKWSNADRTPSNPNNRHETQAGGVRRFAGGRSRRCGRVFYERAAENVKLDERTQGAQSVEDISTIRVASFEGRSVRLTMLARLRRDGQVAGIESKTPAGCTRPTEGAVKRALDGQGWELGGGGKAVFPAESSEHSLEATALSRKPSKAEKNLNIISRFSDHFRKTSAYYI